MAKNYTEHIAKGTFILLFIGIISTILGYGLRVFLAHELSVVEFGLFYSVSSFIYFFSTIKDFGLGQAVAKYIPEFITKKQFGRVKSIMACALSIQFVLGLAIALGLIIFSDLIAVEFFHTHEAKILIQIMAIEFIIGFTVFRSILQGFQKIKLYAIIEPIRIVLVFLFLMFFVQQQSRGVALSYLAAAVVINLSLFFYLSNVYKKQGRKKISSDIIKYLLKFSLTVFAGSIAGTLIFSIDIMSLTYFLSVKDVALYQVALPTAWLFSIFTTAIVTVLLPSVSEIWNSRKKNLLNPGVSLMVRLLFILTIPFSMVFVTFPELALRLIFGETYVAASPLLQVLAISVIFYNIYMILSTTLLGMGRAVIATKIIIYTAIMNIFLNLALINVIGVMGAAFASLLSFIFATAMAYRELNKNVSVSFDLGVFFKTIISSIIAVGVIFTVKYLLVTDPIIEAVVSLLAGFVVYTAFIVASKSVKRSDIKILSEININIPKSLMRFLYRMVKE